MRPKETVYMGDPISRRTFINRTAAGTAFIALGNTTGLLADQIPQDAGWPSDAANYRFHMIGHGHIDPVWLWPWQEGIAVVLSTFRSALDRMNETPGFTFTTSSAQFIEWVAENDPAMLQEIRKRVEEGRWNIVGGWWVEPDMNIPCGEAMVRQGLYGQLTFERLLGRRATVATNPDSFGHTGTLPQIISQQGMENYIFMRPGPHEKNLPADLFWWEGPDGTRVLTYRIQISYNAGGSLKSRFENLLKQASGQPFKSFMAYYGVGDHGGGPTKETIRSIEELKKEKAAPVIFYSTADDYFMEVRGIKNLNLPLVRDDLQHHAVGCYTAECEIKKNNRHSEAALRTAEKIAAIGSSAWGVSYPLKELTSAWHKVLFLQFHDSLAGTSLVEHSRHAREGYGYALDIAGQTTSLALQRLEWRVPAEDPESQYILVFNPHAWEVRNNIEYDLNWGANRKSSKVTDEKGNPLLHQWTGGSSETGSRRKLVVNTAIPPMGYRQLRVMEGETLQPPVPANADDRMLENEYLTVIFSSDGTIGITDKESRSEVFSGGTGGCRAVVIDDPSDTWSHDVRSFSDEIGAFGNASVKVLERGPLRVTIRTVSTYGNSSLSADWSLSAGSRHLEARVTLNWNECLKMLKFSFPVNVEAPAATYETSYGHIIRDTNGDEDPGQRWIDITGNRNGGLYGLTLINDAKYGYNVIGNDMRVSVARSAVFAHHVPKKLDDETEYYWMDQGIQTFRMLLVPHKGNWKENNIPRIAEEFMSPLIPVYQGIHGGSMPKTDSFLAVDSPGIVITAIKKAEKSGDIIFRCVETLGEAVAATVDMPFLHAKWRGNFRPCEIKSLSVNTKTGAVKEVNLLEE